MYVRNAKDQNSAYKKKSADRNAISPLDLMKLLGVATSLFILPNKTRHAALQIAEQVEMGLCYGKKIKKNGSQRNSRNTS